MQTQNSLKPTSKLNLHKKTSIPKTFSNPRKVLTSNEKVTSSKPTPKLNLHMKTGSPKTSAKPRKILVRRNSLY